MSFSSQCTKSPTAIFQSQHAEQLTRFTGTLKRISIFAKWYHSSDLVQTDSNRPLKKSFQIHAIFSRMFKEGILDHWQPLIFAEYQAIDMANRYFTSQCQNPNAVPIEFRALVNPNRMLSDITCLGLLVKGGRSFRAIAPWILSTTSSAFACPLLLYISCHIVG
jgi:hypothetical protein